MKWIQLYDPMGEPDKEVFGEVIGVPTATAGPLWRASIKRDDGVVILGFIKEEPPQQIAAE